MGVRGKSTSPGPDASPNGDPDPTGRGIYNPATGISEWYEPSPAAGRGWSLVQLWGWRDLIEADFASTYQLDVDLATPEATPILQARSWRWFLVRVRGLLEDPTTRLYAALTPDPKEVPR